MISFTLRALAALLRYPDAPLRAALPELASALDAEQALPPARLAELHALLQQLAGMDPMEVESRFIDTFDRGRATSLHLFEHVHGDSRDRGQALVDLGQMYTSAGLDLCAGELPDHLTVVLEFASTQPRPVAEDFLAEMAHILQALSGALRERHSPYACVINAVLDLAGEAQANQASHATWPMPAPPAPEPSLDESWEEPPAFGGCSTQGQSAPIHIVRPPRGPAPQSPQGGHP